MYKKNTKQVTVVVDEKNMELGNLLLGLIAKKGYRVTKLTLTELKHNAKLSSENKVIFLAPSKEFDERKKFTPKMYTEYGMEYGWLANNCIIGVDSAQVNYEDKENIIKLFSEGFEYLKQIKDQEEEKSKKNKEMIGFLRSPRYNRFTSFRRPMTWPILDAISIGVSGYLAVEKYKNKKELVKAMEVHNVVNFTEKGLDIFMEIE